MHRFFAEELSDKLARLSAEDEYHALRVLRMRPGDPCELIWNGARYRAVMRESGMPEILSPLPSTEPELKITLFQGLPKADKMDWIVQKAVEIGITSIIPVIMQRCVVRTESHDIVRKRERWQRIAYEASKQSGRCIVPQVSLPVSMKELISMASALDASLVLWEEAAGIGPAAFASAHSSLHSLGLLIGPEGGIDPGEISQIKECFQPVTLGPRILRTETAGLAAASAFFALYGEME